MSTLYDEIYRRAEPYWATRQNDDHVPSSYSFARRLLSFYPSANEEIVLPALLLHDVGWKEILSIIDGHDTREEPLSLNDKLVKDADKLWRFTPYCLEINHRHFGFELEDYINWLGERIQEWFWTPEAQTVAMESLNRARKEPQP